MGGGPDWWAISAMGCDGGRRREEGSAMWRTPEGERVLMGWEARLFAECLWDLLGEANLGEDGDYELGVAVFDSLSYPQQIAVLHEVGRALLGAEVPSPRLTAVSEGGVAAVFQHLRISVGIEIEDPDLGLPSWRQGVARACRECGVPGVPKVSSTGAEAWDGCIQALEDRILWDADYKSGDHFMDGPPKADEAMKEVLGIPGDYFTAIPPDPRPHEVPRLREGLVALCRAVCRPAVASSSDRKGRGAPSPR